MDDLKKKTAAIAAVLAYIKTEEEAAVCIPAETPLVSAPPPASAMKLWSISGRQMQMQMRSQMQMKGFHR